MADQTLAELLEAIEAGDEEAKERIVQLFGSEQQKAALAARDLKLKTDATLKDRYPRALMAYEKGRLKLGADLTDDALTELLKTEEEALADLGVPLPNSPEPVASTEPVGGDDVPVVAPDPAQSLSGGKAASSPGGQPRDLVAEAIQGYKHGTTREDVAKAHQALVLLNQNPSMRGKVREISAALEATPITTGMI